MTTSYFADENPPNPLVHPWRWVEFWDTWYWVLQGKYHGREPTPHEARRMRMASWFIHLRERLVAGRAALTMNDYEDSYDPLPMRWFWRCFLLLKTLLCLVLDRTDVPNDRWHTGIEIAHWNDRTSYSGWSCDFVEVGPGWRDWWVNISHDSECCI